MVTKGQKGQKGTRKCNVYLADLANEILAEAERLERSPTWLLERVWMIARETIRRIPAAPFPEVRGGRRMYERRPCEGRRIQQAG